MLETCTIVRKLISVIERSGHQSLLYASSGNVYRSVPAPYLEITLMQEGGVEALCLGDLTVPFPSGAVAIHNVHFGAMASLEERFRGLCIFLDLRAHESFAFLAEAPLFHFVQAASLPDLADAFNRLIRVGRSCGWYPIGYPPPPGFRENRLEVGEGGGLLLKAILLEILALLLSGVNGEAETSPPIPEGVGVALSIIQMNYAAPELSLEVLAQQVHLHPDHLGRIFKQHLGETPMRALQRIRIAQSCQLLTSTSKRIGDICLEVGFRDAFHFSRTFKAAMGVSPKGYRERDLAG